MHALCLFFFKQKTAYEMRISDWSSRRVLFRSEQQRGDDADRQQPEAAGAGHRLASCGGRDWGLGIGDWEERVAAAGAPPAPASAAGASPPCCCCPESTPCCPDLPIPKHVHLRRCSNSKERPRTRWADQDGGRKGKHGTEGVNTWG